MRRNDCRLRFGYDWDEERRRSRGASEGNPPQRPKGNRRFSPTSENAAQVRAEKHRRNECRDWHERRMVYAVAAKSPARLSESSGSHVTESGGVATTVGHAASETGELAVETGRSNRSPDGASDFVRGGCAHASSRVRRSRVAAATIFACRVGSGTANDYLRIIAKRDCA